MENKSKYKKYIVFSLITILFISGIAILSQKGYKIQPNLKIAKNGKVKMVVPLKDTTVYLDSKKYTITTKENEEIVLDLNTKTHNIITERAGYFPWQKDIKVKSNELTDLKPVFVTNNTTGLIITPNDTEYYKIRNLVLESKIPTKENPRVLETGEKMWVENNTIIIEQNGKEKEVIRPQGEIKSADFYKNQPENVIFAESIGVYVIDTNLNENFSFTNFFPIYKGSKPIFIVKDNGAIYIWDNNNLLAVVI